MTCLLGFTERFFDKKGFSEQRIGRVHRIGQTENVAVINMVSAESIEQRMLGVLEFKASMAQGVLDPEGDDTIFMSESKFKKFMENVETLSTTESWQMPKPEPAEVQPEPAESEDFEQPPAPSAPKPDHDHPAPGTYVGDADPLTRQEPRPQGQPNTPQELIQTGVSFLSGLSQTLSSPEKTQELVQSIVATDEQTGQTYLKIPVESAAVVENTVKLLGGLLAGLGR